MITFDDVTLRHPGAARPTLANLDFTIPDGDLCLVVGRTGVGKSTLLGAINGLVPHFTGGHLNGDVRVAGRSTRTHRPREMAELVGYVGQNPLAGFVTDRVEDEVAYGMEQLGLSPATMRKRVEETLDIMGIAPLRNRALIELSGGQQQRVAIAAVLAAQPRVVVLDEPTSALDPTAAQDVLASITTLVHEVGLTVVLAEHRLERVMHAADSVLWLPGDGSAQYGLAGQVLARADVVPPLSALARTLGWAEVPLSVRNARRRVAAEGITLKPLAPARLPRGEVVARLDRLRVAYDDLVAVNSISLTFQRGTITALMGRNGAGKSSLMWALQGAMPSTGELVVDGTDPRTVPAQRARQVVSLVPQNATDLLYLPTVGQECAQADQETHSPAGSTAAILARLGAELDPQRHPRDLSEGQRLALVLAIQLAARPALILLDEPTRGLDYAMKQQLHRILTDLAAQGSCILVSTHDVEFAAQATQRTIVLADGDVVADGPTREVCTSSPSFAPQVSKVFHPAEVLTVDEVAEARR
ncbi:MULTISPECIES: ABC transporter ATP-binding protein [unclassified Luteococcus]|uniref:ABC transporter ATP-binding protein n=1 Tax=unclassified Luteococcus TaxID=2639923 RepID=UPI00313C3D7B